MRKYFQTEDDIAKNYLLIAINYSNKNLPCHIRFGKYWKFQL